MMLFSFLAGFYRETKGSSWVHGIPGDGDGLEGVVIIKEIEVIFDVNDRQEALWVH